MSSLRSTSLVASNRVEALDLLRAVAVIAVILFHFGFRCVAGDAFTNISFAEITPIATYGYLGVQLFFVISGFVIAYSADGQSAVQFVISRVSRIYPAFLFCMTATFAFSLLIGTPRLQSTWTQWFANLTIFAPAFKQPFMDGAYWSIVYEIVFYCWVFVLKAAGLFRRHTDRLILAWLAISLLNETVMHFGMVRRLFLTDQSAFFCAGLILYEMHLGRRDLTIYLLLALATVTAISEAFIDADWTRTQLHAELDNLVVAGAVVAIIGVVALATRIGRLPLPPGAVLAVSGVTYPLYLLHQHIGYMLINAAELLAPAPTVITGVIITMIIVAWVVWRYVDRPLQMRTKKTMTVLWERGYAFGLAGRIRTQLTTGCAGVRHRDRSKAPNQQSRTFLGFM